MSDQPITLAVLAQFHREVVVPDIERIVAREVGQLRDEMHTLFDSLAAELKDLRELYTMLSFAVKRIEERLDGIEQRLDKMALRSELAELRARVDGLQAQVRTLEARLEQ